MTSRRVGAQFFLESPDLNPLPAATDFISFAVVGTDPAQTDPWQVLFYGLRGDVLGMFSGTTNGLVSFRRPTPDIHQFVLFNTDRFEGVDDLSFNSPVVPEPSTLILFTSGLVAVAHSVCRRRRSPAEDQWALSSVREVLYRDLYRGEVVWNRSRKRNYWNGLA